MTKNFVLRNWKNGMLFIETWEEQCKSSDLNTSSFRYQWQIQVEMPNKGLETQIWNSGEMWGLEI